MNGNKQIYKPSLLLRIFTSLGITLPIGIPALMIIKNTVQLWSSYPDVVTVSILGGILFCVTLFGVFLFSEEIVIDPYTVIQRWAYGSRMVAIKDIVEVENHKFGRGNRLLKIKARNRTVRMALVFTPGDIDKMVEKIQSFQDGSRKSGD